MSYERLNRQRRASFCPIVDQHKVQAYQGNLFETRHPGMGNLLVFEPLLFGH